MTTRHGIPSASASGLRPPVTAFTLVELLVVVSIMATLFGLMLAGSRPNIGATTRRAAQQFASVLLATQSRAIGNPTGAAVILAPGGPTCREVFSGDRPPLVQATVKDGMLPQDPPQVPPGDPLDLTTTLDLMVTNGGDYTQGYRIKFHGDPANTGSVMPESLWFAFQPAELKVHLRRVDGQSKYNTVWPSAGDDQLHASIICYPARGSRLLDFPKGVGIDLRYSGTGDDPTSMWGNLAAAGDIGLSFDTVGTVDALMRGLGTATALVRQPVEPVYFLVAPIAEITANRSLASEQSLWVTVQPQTGRVTVSSNQPQAGADRTAVRAARASARAALAIGK
jgi:type II secretory pathway pseudopilin PulG